MSFKDNNQQYFDNYSQLKEAVLNLYSEEIWKKMSMINTKNTKDTYNLLATTTNDKEIWKNKFTDIIVNKSEFRRIEIAIDSNISLSEVWINIFTILPYWKEIINNIIEQWNYKLLFEYKKIFDILERNPNNLVEKILDLWNIILNKKNVLFLIEANIENIKILIKNKIITISDINNMDNIGFEIWDISTLVPYEELNNIIKALWITNLYDLITYRRLILDPYSSIEQKINIKKNSNHIIYDEKEFKIYILSKFIKNWNNDWIEFDDTRMELLDYLSYTVTLPKKSYQTNIRALSILSDRVDCALTPTDWSYYCWTFYNHVWNTNKYLTQYEDRILWSREWSQDIAQYSLRNWRKLSVYEQLISNISNQLIDKLPTYNWLVYRWVWKSVNELESSLWKIAVGSIIEDPAIPNFTSHKDAAKSRARNQTLFVIYSKSWKLFLPSSEEHILYKLNTPMRIKDIKFNIEWIDNVIYLEEVW